MGAGLRASSSANQALLIEVNRAELAVARIEPHGHFAIDRGGAKTKFGVGVLKAAGRSGDDDKLLAVALR